MSTMKLVNLQHPSNPNAALDQNPTLKTVSVKAFYMDETEITNSEYRQFVNWVRDSVVRHEIAKAAYEKIGEDISENIFLLENIPHKIECTENIEIRGEVYMSKKNFEKFKNLINMFNKNKSLLNLEKPNIPKDIEVAESNFNIFSKIQLRLTKTFLVAYLSMFILNIGFLPDEDSENFSNTIEFFTDINIEELEEELDDLKYLSKLVVNKNDIIKMILDFISNNNFETDNVVNFEKTVYDKLELISDDLYEQVIYEFGIPNNIFEASDIQLALLAELNVFTNFKKVNDLETILYMREYYLLLDDDQKTMFLKISDNNKIKLINNWINGNKLENLKLERKKSANIAKKKIKKIINNKIKEVKKEEKSFFQKNLIVIIIFNVVLLIILGIYFFRFGGKKKNEFIF